ncbi:MAG: hypothetical protein E6230_16140, partial [Paenibacillus dendritiformis]|nr:hypothetical protein [Paenibacillus dendritiformis]
LPVEKIDLKRSKSQSLDEENGPSPPLHKKQGFSNSLTFAGLSSNSGSNHVNCCRDAGLHCPIHPPLLCD